MLKEKVDEQLLWAAATFLSPKGVRQSGAGEWEIAEITSLTPSYILLSLGKAQ